MAELKPTPPYVGKLLTPSNEKNPVEPENSDKFLKKTDTFDVTKYDEIFDLLVADGQILLPQGAKVSSLEQRKKRGLCKYHIFWGHTTSQCFLFKDLVRNVLNDEILKLAGKNKAPIKIDSDLLHVEEVRYAEPVEINMVKITEDFDMEAEDEAIENQMQSV